MYSFGDIHKYFRSVSGRPAAHTQFCSLFEKELRSALRAPLVTSAPDDFPAPRFQHQLRLGSALLEVALFCPPWQREWQGWIWILDVARLTPTSKSAAPMHASAAPI